MNYDEALEYIHGTLKFGSKLGLHNIGVLLELMGNPHEKLKFVHVGGTNGKGSTAAFISSILMESGYKTGIYTSPYIQRFSERIKINQSEICNDELAKLTAFVKSKVDLMLEMGENHPTEFEIITALAFQYFYESGCDIVVLEVGLGGRFDSTNIIATPELAVITSISFDHMDRLGNTLSEIAFEKAGIIKENGDVVAYKQELKADKVIRDVCHERDARLYITDFSGIELVKFGIDGQVFNYGKYKNIEISLLGEHQLKNALVAIKAVEILVKKGYKINEDNIRNGLKNARWPGRLEILQSTPVFLIDAAHNIEGVQALKKALDIYFPGKKITFIMGVLEDKDYKAMIEVIIPGCKRVITVTPNSTRALPASHLAAIIGTYCKNVQISDTIVDAVKESLQSAAPDEIICSFGSLYYIGDVREAFGL